MTKIYLLMLLCVARIWAEPNIVSEDPVYSFGRIDSKQKVKHIFKVSNNGDKELLISRVRGCCGTTVSCSNKRLMPGESTDVYVKLSFFGKRGSQRKMIYVESNDPDTKYYTLTVSGEVYDGIFYDKSIVVFDDLKQDSVQYSSIIVKSLSNINFVVTNIYIDADYIQSSFSKVADNVYKVDIKTVPPVKKSMNISYIKIFTDNNKYPYVSVPVRTSVLQDIVAMPSKVQITKMPFYKAFVLRSKKEKHFKILNVKVPVEGMSYAVYQLRTASYKLVLKGNTSIRNLKGKKVIVKTDDAENPDVEIEFL